MACLARHMTEGAAVYISSDCKAVAMQMREQFLSVQISALNMLKEELDSEVDSGPDVVKGLVEEEEAGVEEKEEQGGGGGGQGEGGQGGGGGRSLFISLPEATLIECVATNSFTNPMGVTMNTFLSRTQQLLRRGITGSHHENGTKREGDVKASSAELSTFDSNENNASEERIRKKMRVQDLSQHIAEGWLTFNPLVVSYYSFT